MRFTAPFWLSPGDDRPTQTIDSEIAEELRLHLDLLADEERRAGATPDVARRKAAERFGDLPSLQRRCRTIRQGDAPMLRRIQTAVSIAALAGLAVLGWRLHAMASVQHDLLADIEQNRALLGVLQSEQGGVPEAETTEFVAKRVATKRSDLTGLVTNEAGDPLAEADVLLIVKTWPNNRFRQDDFAVKTDKAGRFVLKKKIPLEGRYGVNAAVLAKGHALASHYVFVQSPAGEPDELRFVLTESKPTRLLVTDQDDKPLAKALVVPSARYTEDDDEFLVYFQGSKPAWKKTNAEGVVEVDWFAPGDLGKVTIRPRGGDMQERKFDVDESRSVTIAVED